MVDSCTIVLVVASPLIESWKESDKSRACLNWHLIKTGGKLSKWGQYFYHRNKYMEEKFHSKKNSHSHRVSTKIQCIRPEFRSVLLSFFLCGISFPYIYFYDFYLTGGVQNQAATVISLPFCLESNSPIIFKIRL